MNAVPQNEPVDRVVNRWGDLWAQVSDEANDMLGPDKLTNEAVCIIAALLTIADRIDPVFLTDRRP